MEIRELLEKVKAGALSLEEAQRQLKNFPFEDIGIAKIDLHRELRVGYPEVIFCQGKTAEQIGRIAASMRENGVRTILGTRLGSEKEEALRELLPDYTYYSDARLFLCGERMPGAVGNIVVACAGTADLPVAEEAALTAEIYGNRVTRLYDVGVAGLHRLLAKLPQLQEANAIVAVAGMEGALPSVVAGLVEHPVIAVPTSVGYGANLGGISALLTMLNSCAAGISVVNIDNGFGAGYNASLINKLACREEGDR